MMVSFEMKSLSTLTIPRTTTMVVVLGDPFPGPEKSDKEIK